MAKRKEKWEATVKGEFLFTDVDATDEKIRYGDLFLVRLHDGQLVLAKNINDFGLDLIDIEDKIDLDEHLERKKRKAIVLGRLTGFRSPKVEQMKELHTGFVLKSQSVAKAAA